MDLIDFMHLTPCLPARIVTRDFQNGRHQGLVGGVPDASRRTALTDRPSLCRSTGTKGDLKWAKVLSW